MPGAVGRTSLDLVATYDVTVSISVDTGRIRVRTAIDVENASGGPVDRVELNTIAARLGGLQITVARVDGLDVPVTVDDQTLVVPLGGVLPDGASTRISIAGDATLRDDLAGSDWLFSRAGGSLALYRWIPWVSRSIPFDRPNHGDPFETPSSPSVRIAVTTDRPMVLAAPGAAPVTGPGRGWTVTARDVRDVALVLAPDYAVTAGEADGIPILAYTRPGGLSGDALVAEAAHALRAEAARLGVDYPWPAFSIAETAGGYGMESPGLVWIPRTVTTANLPYLVHHEIAHQWFYGLVGNDQQAQPFADEAPADLLARTVLGALRASRCPAAALDRPITDYAEACYYEVVYIQGGDVLDDLRRAIGTEPFWAALGGYLDRHRAGLGGTRELLDAIRAATSVDLLPTLSARFPSTY